MPEPQQCRSHNNVSWEELASQLLPALPLDFYYLRKMNSVVRVLLPAPEYNPQRRIQCTHLTIQSLSFSVALTSRPGLPICSSAHCFLQSAL